MKRRGCLWYGEWNSMFCCEKNEIVCWLWGEWNSMLICEEKEIICWFGRRMKEYVDLWGEWISMLICEDNEIVYVDLWGRMK